MVPSFAHLFVLSDNDSGNPPALCHQIEGWSYAVQDLGCARALYDAWSDGAPFRLPNIRIWKTRSGSGGPDHGTRMEAMPQLASLADIQCGCLCHLAA